MNCTLIMHLFEEFYYYFCIAFACRSQQGTDHTESCDAMDVELPSDSGRDTYRINGHGFQASSMKECATYSKHTLYKTTPNHSQYVNRGGWGSNYCCTVGEALSNNHGLLSKSNERVVSL